ncbi:MAG TPA: 4-hydroxy-tetrahydrodipicolinate synthase [Candidatus Onthocola gallistercoris]|uniref:4-hydroxy-tetrahydrodipicolinate synthase n=1 Tax=Candidatus Onthocola gallistercoris TaxID=2840876 RepID=A0A9D1KW30_9FIRM|nr:4-hydroxy-tetrahydrodipicolinate synthase [Candidatus Onthocola gallistercoris]
MAIFEGAGVAIVTPMHADGKVNFEKLGELIDFQIAHHTDSIIITGTTGESSTLSEEEHVECIRFAVQHTAGRVPVIAGTGSNCTKTAIELTKEAQKAGADAALIVTPYYNKATQMGLVTHFKTIAKTTDLPIILYSVKSRTGVNIEPQTVAMLFNECDNIVAIKEASSDIVQIADIFQMTQGDMDVYAGNDDQIVPILSLGGKGVISVLSNVCPQETHDIVEKFMKGDLAGSRELQLKAMPLIHALFCEVNPIPVKAAMNMMGMNVGPLRLPMTEINIVNREKLRQAMIDFGIEIKA